MFFALDFRNNKVPIQIPIAKVKRSDIVSIRLCIISVRRYGFSSIIELSVSFIPASIVLYANIPGIMVIQAGIVKTTGGVCTLWATKIPIIPISTELMRVDVISPVSDWISTNLTACYNPPSNPATYNILLGVPNKIPQHTATINAIAKSRKTVSSNSIQ